MVIAGLDRIEHQASMTGGLKKAIDFLRRKDIHELADGRLEIDGKNVFAIVDRYTTKPAADPKFEYHRKYIDVQFIVSGEEVIGWAPADRMTITEAYDPDKDIAFGTVGTKQWTPVRIEKGQAVVLYPEDGHAPKLAAGSSSPVMKIVVKVAVRF